MESDLKKFRSETHRLRSLPKSQFIFDDERNSFGKIYLSVLPFLLAEYVAELTIKNLPAGIVFPVGFLLFWAFYYTFYAPNSLEECISKPADWNLLSLPYVLLGVAIWFVKVTVVQLLDFILLKWLIPKNKAPRKRVNLSQAPKQASKIPPLPEEAQLALQTLGLPECRDWNQIHTRYRFLAKKFHPDLNPDLTDVGRRFMRYHAAYDCLSQYRSRYFQGRKRA